MRGVNRQKYALKGAHSWIQGSFEVTGLFSFTSWTNVGRSLNALKTFVETNEAIIHSVPFHPKQDDDAPRSTSSTCWSIVRLRQRIFFPEWRALSTINMNRIIWRRSNRLSECTKACRRNTRARFSSKGAVLSSLQRKIQFWSFATSCVLFEATWQCQCVDNASTNSPSRVIGGCVYTIENDDHRTAAVLRCVMASGANAVNEGDCPDRSEEYVNKASRSYS